MNVTSDEASRWVGRHATIEPVQSEHYSFLYRLCTDESTGYRWRYRGTTPSPDEFVAQLWQNVACQFVARRQSDRQLVGHLAAHDSDAANGVISVSFCFAPEAWRKGWPLEAAALFTDHLFRSFDLRKIYAEAPEFNAQSFPSAIGTLLDLEGRYRDRLYYDGRYWDVLILALSRERWAEWRPRLIATLDDVLDDAPSRRSAELPEERARAFA